MRGNATFPQSSESGLTSISTTEVAGYVYPRLGPLLPIRSFASGEPHPTGHLEPFTSHFSETHLLSPQRASCYFFRMIAARSPLPRGER